jgi:hypothetical protein
MTQARFPETGWPHTFIQFCAGVAFAGGSAAWLEGWAEAAWPEG